MTLIAGLDVGNTTTEIVIVDSKVRPPELLAWDRAPTRGIKGSVEALHGAVVLLRRMERQLGRTIDLVAVAPHHPVETHVASIPESPPETGRLDVVPAGGDTTSGTGLAVGVPVWANSEPRMMNQPLVLLVPAGVGFKATVEVVHKWMMLGNEIRGLLMADDEGVLVGARLNIKLPIADQVNVVRIATALKVAFEVRPPGHALKELIDPIRLSALLDLDGSERSDALAVADILGGASRGVVALHTVADARESVPGGFVLVRGHDQPMALDPELIASLPVGSVRRCVLPGIAQSWEVDDVWAAGLREVATSVATRIDVTTARAVVLAALRSESLGVMPDARLSEELDLPVQLIPTEAMAARTGALTTLGVRDDAVIADLGGGTIDVMGESLGEVVAAGAGELLTASVAAFLQIPRGAAEWVKRVPSSRLEAPQVVLAEDGVRTFLDKPAPAASVGSLVVPGPAGLLPFAGSLAPASWRSLRLRLKQRILADNLVRALGGLDDKAQDLLLVGGVAGDEELLGILRAVLPGVAVGRANVAGQLGHRYAVAYGLALLAST